jgi:hypothetical protein
MPPVLQDTAKFEGKSTPATDAQVVEALGDIRRSFEQQIAAHPAEIRDVARVLAQAVRDHVADLRAARRNDTESADFIHFLEWLA